MKKLLFAACLSSLGLTTAANAAQFVFGNLVITQIAPENPTTFNDDPIGPSPPFPPGLQNSTVCDSAYCGAIQFSTDGAVALGTSGASATPAGDTTNYLYGVNALNPLGFHGAEVIFNPVTGEDGLPTSFNIYWGSIDALMTNPDGTPRYDNTLTVFTIPSVNTQDSVTGSQLAAADVFGVNGFGSQGSANDNQWFNIRDTAGADPLLHGQLNEERVRIRHGLKRA
jgi:hypothetical protein